MTGAETPASLHELRLELTAAAKRLQLGHSKVPVENVAPELRKLLSLINGTNTGPVAEVPGTEASARLDDLVRDADLFQVYLDREGEWRWRYLVAGIGGLPVITADSGQGYRDVDDAVTGAARVAGVDKELLLATASFGAGPIGRAVMPPIDTATAVRLQIIRGDH